jgi:hypothetical protein
VTKTPRHHTRKPIDNGLCRLRGRFKHVLTTSARRLLCYESKGPFARHERGVILLSSDTVREYLIYKHSLQPFFTKSACRTGARCAIKRKMSYIFLMLVFDATSAALCGE